MRSYFMNPFISASVHVIESFVQAKPEIGELKVIDAVLEHTYVWLEIGIIGEFDGKVIFGIKEQAALKMVTAMMGGYVVTELDDMCRSAISELGNMISGNATTFLYNEGIHVDITPPNLLIGEKLEEYRQALAVSLHIQNIGEFRIHIVA